MTERKDTKIVLIHETWAESFLRDATTVAAFLFLWSVGHFTESPAMEWVGVVIGCGFLFARALALIDQKMKTRMTPDEARAWLDENFPNMKGDQP